MVYRVAAEWSATAAEINDKLQDGRFAECGATQARSAGWVEPRELAHAPLVEVIDGQWLLMLMVEQKVLPGAVVKRQVEALAARIEQETGRKPGKKQLRELKDWPSSTCCRWPSPSARRSRCGSPPPSGCW